MTQQLHISRGLMLIGATTTGALMALAIHILTRGVGFDLAALWQSDPVNPPATAALAWWLMALAGFIGGLISAMVMKGAATGRVSTRIQRLFLAVGVLALIAAGPFASAPVSPSAGAGVIGGIAALCIGAALALVGGSLALRQN